MLFYTKKKFFFAFGGRTKYFQSAPIELDWSGESEQTIF